MSTPQLKLHESIEDSCKAILGFLKKETDDGLKLLMMDDLLLKSRQLTNVSQQNQTLLNALTNFVPLEVRDRLSFFNIEGQDTVKSKKKIDVAIVTVILNELIAAKLALGIELDKKHDGIENGLRFWEATITTSSNRQLSVVLMMGGEAGNVQCATATSRLLNAYETSLCILVGIACGRKKKVKLGDVVFGEIVLDYEYARLETKGRVKRPRPYPLRLPIRRDLQHFAPSLCGWHEGFASRLGILLSNEALAFPKEVDKDFRPGFHDKSVILAGEKLVADGSFPSLASEYDERAKALEMEGAGFARVCEEYDTPWFVARGISDYGDPQKGDHWQAIAALGAATATVNFLKNSYQLDDREF
ncbi:MAG: hypothetical protein AAGA30_16610 [Planctomycetota bacterium]